MKRLVALITDQPPPEEEPKGGGGKGGKGEKAGSRAAKKSAKDGKIVLKCALYSQCTYLFHKLSHAV